MLITRTPWIDDDGSGTTGTVINNAEKQTIYNQIDEALAALTAVDTGSITDVPFNAAHYSAYPSGSWTVTAGQVTDFAWSQMGKIAVVTFGLVGSSAISGSPIYLIVNSPLMVGRKGSGLARITIASAVEEGSVWWQATDPNLYVSRAGGVAWPSTLEGLMFTATILRT
jgi:hypothetical protein